MSLDPKTPKQEEQEAYLKRIKQNYTLNNLEPPFPWTIQPFAPTAFNLHIAPAEGEPELTGEERKIVRPFQSGGGTFGGAGGGSNF